MRAIYLPFNSEDLKSVIFAEEESAKHLHVVRVKKGETILVLNGKGTRVITKVGEILKNKIELNILEIEEKLPFHHLSLAIATPKKDAFEDIVKIAVELGVLNIYPLTSEYSQYVFEESPRLERIIESALIQSNNSFKPIIHPQVGLEEFLMLNNSPLYFFNSRVSQSEKIINHVEKSIILIGPEGGFSTKEESLILEKKEAISIHLATPIQRAPTAVATSIGYLLSK